jgi:hypothetical protein
MALVINDRVKETTTTTGTGAVSLGGAVTGFETFAAGVGNSNTTYYCIAHQDQAEFEVGLGTLDGDSSDLTRTTVISSSNSDSAVDFSAGTKDVFCTIPASKLVFEDGSDNLNISSIKNTSLVVGRDADNDIDFATDNNILFRASGADQIKLIDGALAPVTDNDVDLGTTSLEFKDAFFDGTVEADAITIGGTNVTSLFASLSGANTFTGNIEIDVASGDPTIILDTQGADKFHIAVDDSDSDSFVIKSGGTVGSGNGLKLDSSGNLTVTADVSVGDDLTVEGGVIDFKSNSGSPSILKFYCESGNAHAQSLTAQAHAQAATNTLTLPGGSTIGNSDATLLSDTGTQTVTNKSIDSDNNTITNIVNADIKSSAAIADTKLATISTAGKVALTALEIDGGSDIGADLTTSDLIIVDDGAGGTNRKAALSRVVTLMTAQGFSQEDPTALAIALG